MGIALSFFTLESFAQDGHQWTQQFGSGSMFLGGSVIGSVDDLGAVYYNPGRLSQIEQKVFLYSGNIYEINSFRVKGLVGDKGYKKFALRAVPNLTAGVFTLPFLKKHTFAWAVLVKNDADIKIDLEDNYYQDLFSSTPGKEYFNASLTLQDKLRNTWTCLSWSYPVNEKLSVGLTATYMHLESEKGRSSEMAAMVETTNATASYSYNNHADFKFNGLLWKAGIAYRYRKGSLGLTVLTPVVKMGGKGNYTYQNYSAGLNDMVGTTDIFGYNSQRGIAVEYHSPWAVGLGISHHFAKSTIHFGTEWYSAVSSYQILNPEDFQIQTTGETLNFGLYDQHKSIINCGVGVEMYISNALKSFASFFTDFNSLKKVGDGESEFELNPIRSNYFHLGGGFQLNLKGTSVSLGLSHSGTKSSFSRPIEFPVLTQTGNYESNTSVSWNRWRIMFSLSIPLFKDIEEKFGF